MVRALDKADANAFKRSIISRLASHLPFTHVGRGKSGRQRVNIKLGQQPTAYARRWRHNAGQRSPAAMLI